MTIVGLVLLIAAGIYVYVQIGYIVASAVRFALHERRARRTEGDVR